jgi:rhodanese-related sulfurtransferase
MGFLKRLLGEGQTGVGTYPNALSRRDVDAGELAVKLKESPAPYLLDVREPHEFAEGHIAGAKLIPLGDLARRMGELPRDREIVCVCRSGNRSGTATRHLAAAGYTVANLSGGMISWTRAGLPMTRGTGRV